MRDSYLPVFSDDISSINHYALNCSSVSCWEDVAPPWLEVHPQNDPETPL